MALFGSRSRRRQSSSTPDAAPDGGAADTMVAEAASPVEGQAGEPAHETFSRADGPFDLSERKPAPEYLDFGGLKIAAPEGSHVRLDVDQATDSIVAVTVDIESSSLQLQAFSAPKTSGLWDEIAAQIRESVASQGGSSELIRGEFGTELFVKLPVTSQDGSLGYRSARFLGVDGPRWFVRGVLGGPAATDEREAEALCEVFRTTIIERGDHAMPPKELLPLTIPSELQTV